MATISTNYDRVNALPSTTSNMRKSLYGPKNPGDVSTRTLLVNAQKLLKLMADNIIAAPTALEPSKKSIKQNADGSSQTSWIGRPSFVERLADEKRDYSVKLIIREACELLKQNGVAFDAELEDVYPQCLKLTTLPKEILDTIVNHAVYNTLRSPTAIVTHMGQLDIFEVATWNAQLIPLTACKQLYKAGKDQIFFANEGSWDFLHHDEEDEFPPWDEPEDFIPRNSPTFLICASLRRLSFTLGFELPNSGLDGRDLDFHDVTAERIIKVLRTVKTTCPLLTSLHVLLSSGRQELPCPMRQDQEAHDVVLDSLWKFAGVMRSLDISEKKASWQLEGETDWSGAQRNITHGPLTVRCDCDPLKDDCDWCAYKEFVYCPDSSLVMSFDTLSADGLHQRRGNFTYLDTRVVEVEEEVEEVSEEEEGDYDVFSDDEEEEDDDSMDVDDDDDIFAPSTAEVLAALNLQLPSLNGQWVALLSQFPGVYNETSGQVTPAAFNPAPIRQKPSPPPTGGPNWNIGVTPQGQWYAEPIGQEDSNGNSLMYEVLYESSPARPVATFRPHGSTAPTSSYETSPSYAPSALTPMLPSSPPAQLNSLFQWRDMDGFRAHPQLEATPAREMTSDEAENTADAAKITGGLGARGQYP